MRYGSHAARHSAIITTSGQDFIETTENMKCVAAGQREIFYFLLTSAQTSGPQLLVLSEKFAHEIIQQAKHL